MEQCLGMHDKGQHKKWLCQIVHSPPWQPIKAHYNFSYTEVLNRVEKECYRWEFGLDDIFIKKQMHKDRHTQKKSGWLDNIHAMSLLVLCMNLGDGLLIDMSAAANKASEVHHNLTLMTTTHNILNQRARSVACRKPWKIECLLPQIAINC